MIVCAYIMYYSVDRRRAEERGRRQRDGELRVGGDAELPLVKMVVWEKDKG